MTNTLRGAAIIAACVFALGCEKSGAGAGSGAPPAAKLTVTSTALQEGAAVPPAYACTDYDHLGKSPPIAWSAGPAGTVAYAITVLDPDAKSFGHWGVVGIPSNVTSLADGASPGGALPPGASDLENAFDKKGYGGPCPPPGKPHHYVFTVYALREKVDATKIDEALAAKLNAAALAAGTLTATFQR